MKPGKLKREPELLRSYQDQHPLLAAACAAHSKTSCDGEEETEHDEHDRHRRQDASKIERVTSGRIVGRNVVQTGSPAHENIRYMPCSTCI